MGDAVREVHIAEQSYCRWQQHHGGNGTNRLRALKPLQKEHDRLRKAVSYLTLDKLIRTSRARAEPSGHRPRQPYVVTGACDDEQRERIGPTPASERLMRSSSRLKSSG
ncbi:hypothetical protein [Microbaculum sp. FT89]|uniref:hypothetical protein n=1 Tax=Microbaculum sp. FT89 TaxID=3447298 RepID=UPI003F5378C5